MVASLVTKPLVEMTLTVDTYVNGLQWVPDLTSGDNNAPNSKLLVSPVNMTHNQSSCQFIIELIRSDTVISSVGTMTCSSG